MQYLAKNTSLVVGILLTLIGGALLLAFYVTLGTVDGEGWLHEPFYLLGSGYIAILAGACTLGYWAAKHQAH